METRASEPAAVVRTFLIADVRGYTSFTQARGDEVAGELAAKFAALAREVVPATGGEVVELRGDEALCVFPSARQALRAAVDLQVRFRERVDGEPVFPLGIGIGLAAGEAVPVEGGYRGGALNLAARLCSLATAGRILASETVTSLAGTLEGVRFLERRPVRLKGLEKRVKVIEVVSEVALPPAPDAPRRKSARRRLLLSAAGAVIVLGGIAAFLVELKLGGDDAPAGVASVAPDSLAAVDPKTNEIVGQVQIPGGPSAVAAGRKFVWVVSDASRTVSSIASDGSRVTRVVSLSATPSALAADGDAVWVLDADRRRLLKIDSAYGAVTRRIKLPAQVTATAASRSARSASVASGAGARWVTDGSSRLFRLDSEGAVEALDVRAPLEDVAVGAGSVWAISGRTASVYRIDARGRRVETRIRIVNRLGTTAPFPVAVAVGEGAVWVVNGNTQTVSRIDPEFGGVTATIPLGIGRNPSDIAVGEEAVWVANSGNATLARIDPGTNAVSILPLGVSPAGVAVGHERIWVTVQPGFRANIDVPRGAVEASGTGARGLPASFCSPVEFQGEGQPRYLIASDLPLQGQATVREALEMSDAIRFVLARRGFRAGAYSVGYQSCDNSIASTGNWDAARCKANARAYAASEVVIGVIGGYNSGCVQAQLAPLAGALGGPLAIVGTASTYVGLTRAGPGAAPGEPQKYHPDGKQSFVRLVAADDLQGAAAALLAKQLRVTKLFVLHDGDPYGFGIASVVREAAATVGIPVVGFGRWEPRSRSYTTLARRVRRTGADGVFVGGSILESSNGAAVVRDLRSVLDERVRIVTPDGFSLFAPFVQAAGPAAERVMVTVPFALSEQLPTPGRSFVADFEEAIGRPVEALSVYAAQATEVLLRAIARSDGSRASVTAELFKTQVTNGLLGSFSFDRNGDTTAGTVTIYEIERGKPVVFDVITPPPSLVR